MPKWTTILIGCGVLLAIGWGYVSLTGGVPVEIANVERGEIREYIDDEGKTRLEDVYQITMPYTGRIEAIDLVEGTSVKKGQVVARIVPLDLELNVAAAQESVERLKASIRENDDTTVENTGLQQSKNFVESMDATVEAAQERLKSGEAKLAYANKWLERVERLQKTRAQTEDVLDQAKVNQVESAVNYQQDKLVFQAIKSLRAATALMPTAVEQYIARKDLKHEVLDKQLAEAQINLRHVKKDQARGTMTSPIDGVILERAVSNEGQLAAGTLLLKIGRLEDLEVESDVLSQEVVQAKVGDLIEVSGPAIGTPAAQANITRIYPAGFTKVSSLGVDQQRVKVVAKFDPKDLERLRKERELGVGYRVRVRIYTAQESNALVIPRSAMFRAGDGGWRVFCLRGRTATLQPIKVGLMNDEQAQIVEGLSDGDRVVRAPDTNLTDGQTVRAIER